MRKPSLQSVLPLWLTLLKLLKKAPKNLTLPEDLLNPNLLLICAGSLQTDSFRWPPIPDNAASAKKRKTRTARLALMASCAASNPDAVDSFRVYYHNIVSSPRGALCGSEDGTEYNTASSTLFLESECEESPRDFFDCCKETMSAAYDEDAAAAVFSRSSLSCGASSSCEGDQGCVLLKRYSHRKMKGRTKPRQSDQGKQKNTGRASKQASAEAAMAAAELELEYSTTCKEEARVCCGCQGGMADAVQDMAEDEFRVCPIQQKMSQNCVDSEEEEAVTDAGASYRNLYSTDALISRHNPIINHIRIIQTSEAEDGNSEEDENEEGLIMNYPHASTQYKLGRLRCAADEQYRSYITSSSEEESIMAEEEEGEEADDACCDIVRYSTDKILLSMADGRGRHISLTDNRTISRQSRVSGAIPLMNRGRSHGSLRAAAAMAKASSALPLGTTSQLCRYGVPILLQRSRCEAMAKYSRDPCSDFTASMREMMEAHEIRDGEDLEELLQCYLQLNPPDQHGTITLAFLSAMIDLNILQ